MQFGKHSTVCIVPTSKRLPTKMFKNGAGWIYGGQNAHQHSTCDHIDSKTINQKNHTLHVEMFPHEGKFRLP